MTKRGKGDPTSHAFQIIYLWAVLVLPTFTPGSADQEVCLSHTGHLYTCGSPPPRLPECPTFCNATIECPSDINVTCGCSDVCNVSYMYSVAYYPSGCNAITYMVPPYPGQAINVTSKSCSLSKEPKAPNCSHGFQFPVGTTEVTCQAFDYCDRVKECSFNVTIEKDVDPPTMMTIECSYVVDDSSCCANISCNVTDTCADPNDLDIHCEDLDGNVLEYPGPICTENLCTNVTCTATDQYGNNASDIFPIKTNDTDPPTIECSYVVDDSSCCANISCNVTDTCADPNDLDIHCEDLDGNVLEYPGPICTENLCTNVTCTATDQYGNNASDIFPFKTNEPCPFSVVSGNFGTLTFRSTNVNQKAESKERCFDYATYTYRGNPRATRRCRCDVWEEPILAICPVILEGEDINDLLRKISQAYVTAENVTQYSFDLLQATENATDINAKGLSAIAIALQKIAAVMASSEEVTNNVFQIVDNVLYVPNMEFVISDTDVGAPTEILDALEQQITLFQTEGNQNNLTITGDNLAVAALRISLSSLDTGLGFGSVTSPSTEENESASKDFIQTMVFSDRSDIPRAILDASIALPLDVLNFVPPSVRENGTAPVTFLIFQNSKLFQSSDLRNVGLQGNSGRLLVGTRVISATVEGAIIEELPEGREVETTFLELNVIHANETVDKRTCVFWEKTDDGGRWSSEGCRREDLPNVNRIRCLCNHLTSFAVLLDVSGDSGQEVLDLLSMIGCIISIICLVITLVTFLSMKNLREKQPQKILINLCFSLLGLYLVFVVGIDRRNSTTGCVVIGFLIHFFLLSSMLWMTVEAVNMHRLFVKVFNAKVSHFMLKASLCAYGLPLVVCIVIVVVDSSLYLGDDTYCFVKPGPSLYYGVMLIVAVLLVVNFIMFGLIMRRLSCRRFTNGTGQTDRSEKWRRVQNAVAISILLGLTWLFGFLAIGSARLYFNILFLIFNSLQGFFIFLMFCVRQKEVLDQWKQWIHCQFGDSHVQEQHHKEKCAKKKNASSRDRSSSVEMSSNKESMTMSTETSSTSESSIKI